MAVPETVTSEHAKEYVRLVNSGSRPGGDTMRQARTNVAHQAAGTVGEDTAIEAAGGGPEDPVADVATIANTLRKAKSIAGAAGSGLGSLGKQVSTSSSLPRQAYGQVSSPSRTAQTLTRLIWAVALGLIVLEVASEATGQSWSFNLPGTNPLKKGAYKPLYSGQTPGSAPATLSAMPLVLPGAV